MMRVSPQPPSNVGNYIQIVIGTIGVVVVYYILGLSRTPLPNVQEPSLKAFGFQDENIAIAPFDPKAPGVVLGARFREPVWPYDVELPIPPPIPLSGFLDERPSLDRGLWIADGEKGFVKLRYHSSTPKVLRQVDRIHKDGFVEPIEITAEWRARFEQERASQTK